MKLSTWAKKQGISYKTAHKWFQEDKIPYKTEQMPTGTIIVHDDTKEQKTTKVCIYSRVSTYERKSCLDGQVERCTIFANAQGLQIDKIYKEIASGMNDKRTKLMQMLDEKPTHIIIEHKDRLTRFGFNYLEKLLNQQGCTILILNKEIEDEKDLMKDLILIITSFCCRLYGLRRGQNKAKKLKQELENNE